MNKKKVILLIMKNEMNLINTLEQKSNVDEYVDKILDIFGDQENKINQMKQKLLGRLTREIEEKNQKIDNYEINNKNLTIKIENLILQNKSLSNREKKMMDENEYLITNMDKIKDENEKYKTKIIQIETLKQNVLKDYEELSNNFLKLKKEKEEEALEVDDEEEEMKSLKS